MPEDHQAAAATQAAEARRPVPAAISVVLRGEDVLLVRRANPPDAGYWGFPGGKIEAGESINAAAERELFEETTVRAQARRCFSAVDVFDRAEDGSLRQQFVLLAVLCRWQSGEPVARDDALEARWFRLDELDQTSLLMSAGVNEVLRQAAQLLALEGL